MFSNLFELKIYFCLYYKVERMEPPWFRMNLWVTEHICLKTRPEVNRFVSPVLRARMRKTC